MEKHEVESKVKEIVKRSSQFNPEDIQLELDLRDNYGIDSIVLVELLVEIEADFDITIDSNLLTYERFSTAGAIADYVYEALNS